MFQYTPYALMMISAGMISTVLATAVWRRPDAGVKSFSILMLATAFWAITNGSRMLVTTQPAILVLYNLQYLGIIAVPTTWFIFVLEYTGRDHWLTRRNLILLAIMPAITVLAYVSNSWHYQFWTEVGLVSVDSLIVLQTQAGPLFWVHSAYSYLLMAGGVILLVQTMIRSPQLYRGQMVWLLVGALAPWVANAIYIFEYSPLPSFVDLTPLAFTILGMAAAWSMYRYRLMDILPVAKDLIIDSLGDAVIVLDRQNRIVEGNRAAGSLLGVPAREFIGLPAREVLSSQTELVEKFRDVEETTEEISLVVRGLPRTFNMMISPIRNRQGELTGRAVVLHDITALKQANAELLEARRKAEEANQLKTQFLATMSHELRTPLNAISGFTEILMAGMAGDLSDLQRSNLKRIFTNATDLRRLIDDMLDLAKIEAGRMELIRKPFVLKEWLEEIEGQTRGLAEGKNLTYTTLLDETLPTSIIGDPNRLKQVVVNLVSNAIKFTAKGGVRLELQRQGKDRWAIRISDTGIGIPPHAQEVIFDRFRQIDGSTQRKYGGSGLGLAIVRDLTLMMGGNVRVKSALGEGSTFTVLLPLVVESGETVASIQVEMVG